LTKASNHPVSRNQFHQLPGCLAHPKAVTKNPEKSLLGKTPDFQVPTPFKT
jgi:hypothetical protein